MKDLISKVKEIKELKAMQEELNVEIASLEDCIKEAMLNTETEEFTAGIYKVRYAKVKSKRFDSKAFKEQYGALYEQFVKETESRRFSIV